MIYNAYVAELVNNIRRNLRHMREKIELTDENSNLIDHINHTDSLAQQIETELYADEHSDGDTDL